MSLRLALFLSGILFQPWSICFVGFDCLCIDGLNFAYPRTFESTLQLPTQDKLKTVLDKVKDFFGDAKESFGKLTALNSNATEEEEVSKEKANVC